MPDHDESVVFSAPAASLTDAHVAELQEKFGMKLHVRARTDAVASALNRIGEAAVQNFDRVNPGYERVFDRTAGAEDIRNQVINPVDLEAHVRNIATRIIQERPGG